MNILNYRHVSKGIPIESILDVNTFLMCSTWNISDRTDQVKADFAEFKNQFITERLAEGATMQEAFDEGENLQELLETPEVKESYTELKKSNEKLSAITEKIAKLDEAAKTRASELSKVQMESFLNESLNSFERQWLKAEYNVIAKNCLIKITNIRERIQDWAADHPQAVKIAQCAMDIVWKVAEIGTYAAIVSSVIGTAPLSIPLAIGGAAVALGKKFVIKQIVEFSREMLTEYAWKLGEDSKEGREFVETVEFGFSRFSNGNKIRKFAKNPAKKVINPEYLKTYLSKKIDRDGELAFIFYQNVRAYSAAKNDRLLQDVISILKK